MMMQFTGAEADWQMRVPVDGDGRDQMSGTGASVPPPPPQSGAVGGRGGNGGVGGGYFDSAAAQKPNNGSGGGGGGGGAGMGYSDRAAMHDGASPPVLSTTVANGAGGGGGNSDAVSPVRNGAETVLLQRMENLTENISYLYKRMLPVLRKEERGDGSHHADGHDSRGGGGDTDARDHGGRDRDPESGRRRALARSLP